MAGLLKASEAGLKIVDMVRRNLGWNKTEDAWCLAALVSRATLKRFWARTPIRRENFINICKAVEIENWENIAEGRNIEQIQPLLAAAIADLLRQENLIPENFALPQKLPPVRNWVGRCQDLDLLKSYLVSPTATTAICIVGFAGIGKTTFASQLVRQLQTEPTPFVAAAWECLESPTGVALPCDRILDSLLFVLSNGEITSSPTNEDFIAKTERLLELLKDKPCLVVFDRVETVLSTGVAQKAGYFSDRSGEYAWLFKQLIEREHQSKIIFLTCESLAEFPPTATDEISLNGLNTEAAIALLQSFNLAGTESELAQLAQRYQGHPKALELVAKLIRNEDEFQGNVGKFLQARQWLLTREIENTLDRIYVRLSELAQTCLCRISVYQSSEYPVSLEAIATQMPEVSLYDLKEHIIRSLKVRQFLFYDPDRESYQLHPFVQEKAYRLLSQDSDKFRNAHCQAYQYFIAIPLKSKSEWKEIDDIKPLLIAYYHGSLAEELPEATQVISGLDDCWQLRASQFLDTLQHHLLTKKPGF